MRKRGKKKFCNCNEYEVYLFSIKVRHEHSRNFLRFAVFSGFYLTLFVQVQLIAHVQLNHNADRFPAGILRSLMRWSCS